MILCMNATTSGLTEWSLDWLGVAAKDGVIYGVTSTALVALNGDAEDGFSGSFSTGELNFGTHRDKRIPKAYFEIEMPAAVTFTTGVSSYGNATDYPYPIEVRDEDGDENATFRREDLGRKQRGPWWSFALSGSEWSLGVLKVITDVVSRRF